MQHLTKFISQRLITAIFILFVTAAMITMMSHQTLGQNLSNQPQQKSDDPRQMSNGSPLLSLPQPETSTAPQEIALTDEESQLISLINQERSHTGLNKLEVDPFLVKLARDKSRDMVRHNYFGHISKRFGTVYDQFKRSGISSQALNERFIAENLAGAPNCCDANQQMLASPAHRNNMLNSNFRRIGIGVAKGGPFGMMITEIFMN